jgi:hypothetical protein
MNLAGPGLLSHSGAPRSFTQSCLPSIAMVWLSSEDAA